MAESTSPSADSPREGELVDLIQRLAASLSDFSDRLPFIINRQKLQSIITLAALAISLLIAWKLLRSSPNQERRQHRRSASSPGRANSNMHSGEILQSAQIFSSSADTRAQLAVDQFFQPVKLTLEQLVRHKLNDTRKVTCRLLGIVLEETEPEELRKHATVRSSVLDVLMEISKFCDVYLMERILDDESEERVLNSLVDSGVFTSGGLLKDKVLFCSTENGRISFVRQLEPDWHIDTNPEILYQLSRFIKCQLHITTNRSEHVASNVFSSASMEQFFGGLDGQ